MKRLPSIACGALAALACAATLSAQDAGRIAPPSSPTAPPLVASPVEPGDTGLAPAPPAMIAIPPDSIPSAPPNAAAPAPAAPVPKGATVSGSQARSGLIEAQRPERVPVYPDDPECAWWEIDPRHAFERAQREQRPLMLLFTGSWNAQGMALSQEVFATKSFNDYVKENLVICYLNYPQNITDAPDALRRIKEKFKVKGYPNVLIFNPNGEVERGIRGYRSGRPVDYFNRLVAACHPVLVSIEGRKAELVSRGYRDWSNYLGKLVFARFVERDASRAVLQDAVGVKWTVPINDLAPDDQRLVESFPALAKTPGQ